MPHGCRVSSCRRCWVKSCNDATSCQQLPSFSWAVEQDCRRQAGGTRGWRQVLMAPMTRASHVIQWSVQRVALQRDGLISQKPIEVRTALSNYLRLSRRREKRVIDTTVYCMAGTRPQEMYTPHRNTKEKQGILHGGRSTAEDHTTLNHQTFHDRSHHYHENSMRNHAHEGEPADGSPPF